MKKEKYEFILNNKKFLYQLVSEVCKGVFNDYMTKDFIELSSRNFSSGEAMGEEMMRQDIERKKVDDLIDTIEPFIRSSFLWEFLYPANMDKLAEELGGNDKFDENTRKNVQEVVKRSNKEFRNEVVLKEIFD